VIAKLKVLSVILLMTSGLATLMYLATGFLVQPVLAETGEPVGSLVDPTVLGWGYMAAALVTGLSTLAAGIAVASVGASAVGAIAEKPELFGRAMVLVGLAEGIAIYGMIISIIILNRLV
jgi:V/A-type H+/Na+-transporting ATPase subunit K